MTLPGKVPLAWILLVGLSLGLLAAVGWRLAAREAETLESRFQGLLRSQLQSVDATIQGYFQTRERELLDFMQRTPLETEILRDYLRRQPRVRQLLVLGADGQRLHPPTEAPLSRQETAFLQRTAGAWEQNNPAESGQAASARGWLVWPWGRETGLIFRQRDARGRLFGFELEPMRLLADVIGLLPVSEPAANAPPARVQLLDGRGEAVYQWGEFQPPVDSEPRALLALSAPLQGWHLAYHAPDGAVAQQRLQWLLVAGFVAVGVALTALAGFLYREHRRAEELARQRVNFVNQVSHELKTPLTNVRMYGELLQEELLEEDATASRYAAVIVAESERLSRLIENVLSFARQQRGRLQLHRRPVQPDGIIARVLAAFRPALDARQVVIQFSPGAPDEAFIDPDALEQILNNLLGNVEKYAHRGGAVEIASQQDGQQLRITVQDHGPGIPQRDREQVFRPFYRLGERLDEGASGAGIGLSIARELARLHGGELRLRPSTRGACFELQLPLQASGNTP